MLLRLLVCLFFFPAVASAAVIETNEWDNLTRPNWFYGGRPVEIDFGAAPPSGGGALKFRFGPGSQTESISGGIARYALQQNYQELYVGHWIKWSSNWLWHPVASKMDYFYSYPGSDGFGSNVLTAVYGNSTNTGGCRGGALQTVQRIWSSGSYNMPQNGNPNFCPGQWYWVEWHLKMNTPGSANGIYEFWVNGVLISSVFDMAVAAPGANGFWQDAQHSPEYGGGGSATLPVEQNIWVDHTVLSTTPIGVPGGPPPPDTTPPSPPTNFTVN